MKLRRLLLPLACALALAGASSRASAQNCSELGANVVIGAGGSASVPLLARVARALRAVTPPIQLVYQSPGACFGITPYTDDTPITGTANWWDDAGVQQTCNLPIAGVIPDFGMMGTAATLCPGITELPDGIGDFAGPITSWSLIVPSASTQQVISQEAIYFVYGFGGVEGQVSPWTNQAHLWGRNATSAALIAIALAAQIPPERMAGFFAAEPVSPPIGAITTHDVRTNSAMIERVAAGTALGAADATLGFVSTEVADAARDRVRTLAYQHRDQECGYWPDSTATAFDKQNVRDGHYYLWSAYHFYAPVDDAGEIEDPDTRRFIEYFTDSTTVPDTLPLLDLIIANGNIPECAMQVWRDSDLGPLYSYQPELPCVGYYENEATGDTTHRECATSAECIDAGFPTCRLGFCEVR